MSDEPAKEYICPTCDASETSASTGTCPMLRTEPLIDGYLRLLAHGWRAIRWESPELGASEIIVIDGGEAWCFAPPPGRAVPDDGAAPGLQTDGDATDVSGRIAELARAIAQGQRVVKWVHPKHGTAELSLSGEWEISGVPRYRTISTKQEDGARP